MFEGGSLMGIKKIKKESLSKKEDVEGSVDYDYMLKEYEKRIKISQWITAITFIVIISVFVYLLATGYFYT